MQRESFAVLASVAHLATHPDDPLDAALQMIGDVVIMLRFVRLRHEHFDILTDQFRGVVAEEVLGRRIYALDEPAIADRDDGLHGSFQDAAGAWLLEPQLRRAVH
jgi:hypothetical protein